MVVMRPQKTIFRILKWNVSAMLLFGFISGAAACPLPVFQFSLEYWKSNTYDVVVHYDAELSDRKQAVVDMLPAADSKQEHHANINVILNDHAGMNHPNPSGKELPRIELRYPMISGIRGSLWEGPLKKNLVKNMFHSPMRQKIAEKLLERDAGIFVLLESGNTSKDRKALNTLEEELSRLEKTLTVDTHPAEQYGMDLGELHTDINFPILTLSRDNPDEQMFITMLLGVERDLKDYENEPIVFPIYGRGLVMYALIGDGINAFTLSEVGAFLTATGSCQINVERPGVDILMSFDWENNVERQSTYDFTGVGSGILLDP